MTDRPPLDCRPVKRSLTLRGHRTSVSLEEPFWVEFRKLADARGLSINALAVEIDEARAPDVGLASAVRVYVLSTLIAERDAETPDADLES